MSGKIDYNRGVSKRIDKTSGIEVFMYKDEPGVFRNAYGTPVGLELAKAAGFPVHTLMKKRARSEKMKQAMKAIEAEYALDESRREVVEVMNGFRLVAIGHERYIVEDPDGANLTPSPLPESVARVVLNQIAPKEPVSEGAPETAAVPKLPLKPKEVKDGDTAS